MNEDELLDLMRRQPSIKIEFDNQEITPMEFFDRKYENPFIIMEGEPEKCVRKRWDIHSWLWGKWKYGHNFVFITWAHVTYITHKSKLLNVNLTARQAVIVKECTRCNMVKTIETSFNDYF